MQYRTDELDLLLGESMILGKSIVFMGVEVAMTEAESVGLTASGLQDLFPHVIAVSGLEPAAKKDSPSAVESGSAASSP